MRPLLHTAVFVLVPLTLASLSSADEKPIDMTAAGHHVSATPVSATATTPQLPHPSPGDGFAQYRRIPTWGNPGSPTFGRIHYDGPMRSYTHWYRPKAHELTKCLRCAEEDFRPKGYGNLFARPRCTHRLDYAPYVLRDSQSEYGPAYIMNGEDQRCEKCDACSGKSCLHSH